MFGENTFIDSMMDTILNSVFSVIKVAIDFIFSNDLIALFSWLLFLSLIAFFIMKKDKQYAKDDKRRVRESTLIMLALAGGATGMYIAMYKYKHKTLHKKFTILVPTFIVLHFALVSYVAVKVFVF